MSQASGPLEAEIERRERAEKALRASEEQFQHLVEDVQDYAIFLMDASGTILSWNAGAERIKGYRPDEIIGRNFSCFYTPEDARAGAPERGLAIARNQGRFEGEGWRLRKDGTRFWASVVITALCDERGKLRGFLKITRDLNEQKRSEERLREVNAELELRVRGVQPKSLGVSYRQPVRLPLDRVTHTNQARHRPHVRMVPSRPSVLQAKT